MSFAGTNFLDFGFQSLTLEVNVRGFRAIFSSVFVARKLFTTTRDVILSCLFHLFVVLMSTIVQHDSKLPKSVLDWEKQAVTCMLAF